MTSSTDLIEILQDGDRIMHLMGQVNASLQLVKAHAAPSILEADLTR